jgi:hypothetical protein
LEGGGAVVVNADSGDALDSMVEFGDFYEQTADRKTASRLQMRVVLDELAEMKISVQYDSEGLWRPVKTLKATKKMSFSYPVKIRRCDHYRIRLEGKGYWEVQNMARAYRIGTGVH